MDVSALKYFIVAAQTEHMSRAAEKLNITQPSLSASIKRLEADIGFQLFDRTGRGIRLNEYGRIFLTPCSVPTLLWRHVWLRWKKTEGL